MPDDLRENVGYMSWEQFERFRWAVNDSLTHVGWWRVCGYVNAGDTDVRVQSSSTRPLGLPPAWLAAEEVTRLSGELQQWPDLEDVANDLEGAEIAALFTREVQTAKARWPIEDRPHRVKFIRCRTCQMRTLRYQPPRGAQDRIRVSCTSCGAVMDEDEYTTYTIMVEAEDARRLGDRETGDRDGGQVIAGRVPVGGGGEGAYDAPDAGAVA